MFGEYSTLPALTGWTKSALKDFNDKTSKIKYS
jgi:hypothetical protein